MKVRVIYFVIFIYSLFLSSVAYSSDFSYESLVGKWHSEKQHSSGAILSADISINTDHTFNGTVSANGKVIWIYDGEIELVGDQLTWKYKNSSNPMPPNATDTDTVISIEADSYSYIADIGGEVNTYHRVK